MNELKILRITPVTEMEPVYEGSAVRPVVGYGTLRTGKWNHGLMHNFTSAGLYKLSGAKMYGMYNVHDIPFVVPAEMDSSVVVEIFDPDGFDHWLTSLRNLDRLESSPDWYTRCMVELAPNPYGFDTLWMYFFLDETADHYIENGATPVPSGDWHEPFKEVQNG